MKAKLENLTYRGQGTLEKIPCPLCRADQFKILLVERELPIVRCEKCSLVFVNPRPSREGLLEFYKDYFPPESESLWQEQMAAVFLKEGLEKIKRYQAAGLLHLKETPAVLDIGCGMGCFLDLMRAQGWKTFGVEPSPSAARHAKEKLHLNVFEGMLEEAELESQWDVVTLWYVLEHVPHPDQILDRVSRLLRPGGLIIIRAPNQNAGIDLILNKLGLKNFFLINPPRHLFDYSPKTLSRFLEERGLEVLEIRNSIPRATGTWLELARRRLWYRTFQALYSLSGGKWIRGSSITVYARKK